MQAEKITLLFGELPDGADPDNPDDRATLLAPQQHIHDADWLGPARRSALASVADQIAEDDPPQVWQTAQRLLGSGLDRRQVLQQLVLAMHESQRAWTAADIDPYLATLARLPVPDGDQIAAAIIATVRAHQPVDSDELGTLVAEQLEAPPDDPLIVRLIDQVVDQFLSDPSSPVTILTGDVVVHVESFTAGIVLTHCLSDAEQEAGILDVGADLAGFQRRRGLRLPSGAELTCAPDDQRCWAGPPGWLDDLPAGACLAVRIDDDGTVRITALDQPPTVSGELVELLRTDYDDTVAEPWLPVEAESLVLGMLLRRPETFAEPAAPLTELGLAAGLELREDRFAHEESVWESQRRMYRDWRVIERLGRTETWAAIRVLHVLDDAPPLDAASARAVLVELYDSDVLLIVSDELLGPDDDAGRLARAAELSERLLRIASVPDELAVAHWLAAVVAERRGAVHDAESHLRAAVRADSGWWSAVDRLAWYQSDRGDAAAAVQLWQQVGVTIDDSDEMSTVARFAATPAPRLGRNEPCWCGSGRKFKICHLNRPILAPLPERVGWLCRKAFSYLRRRRGEVLDSVIEHILARAVDLNDPQSLRDAVVDPLVFDVVLHEGGWFARFLAERGPLLPEDEAVLAQSWTGVPRTGYEVLDTQPGGKCTLRELRTGEHVEVRESSTRGQAQAGVLLCGRVVPDGESHQFLGGVFTVPAGHEHTLFDLLDKNDEIALLEYVAELHRPSRPE